MDSSNDTDEPLIYESLFLARRRHDKRIRDRVLWWIVGTMLGIMLMLAMVGSKTAPAEAGSATKTKSTCNEQCQLTRRLNRICPSEAGAMTRARCIQWIQVAQCEAGGQQRHVTLGSLRQINWKNDGVFDGGLQFKQSTWSSNMNRIASAKLTREQRRARSAGRYGHAYDAPPSVQILAAEVLRVRIGGDPHQTAGWPHCGAWFYS